MATMAGVAIGGERVAARGGGEIGTLELEDVYTAYEPEIRAYVATRFPGRVVAEDIAQEAFARLVREAAAGRMPALVRPWLYRVAHNLAVSELRRPVRDGDDAAAPGRHEPRSPSAEVEFEAWSVGPELREALATLSAPARLSILMAADGYDGREIATAVGRSELAVRALLCRTRRALRELLGAADAARPDRAAELVA